MTTVIVSLLSLRKGLKMVLWQMGPIYILKNTDIFLKNNNHFQSLSSQLCNKFIVHQKNLYQSLLECGSASQLLPISGQSRDPCLKLPPSSGWCEPHKVGIFPLVHNLFPNNLQSRVSCQNENIGLERNLDQQFHIYHFIPMFNQPLSINVHRAHVIHYLPEMTFCPCVS